MYCEGAVALIGGNAQTGVPAVCGLQGLQVLVHERPLCLINDVATEVGTLAIYATKYFA